ncbi:MAG: MFS transporter, partial [Actinomadura sp.]
LFCLAFALTEGQRYDWNPWIWALLGASVVLFGGFLLQQRARQDREPLVPFALFRNRNFTVMSAIGAIVSVGMVGMFLPSTLYLQSVLGYSALKAGLVLAPSSVVSMFLAPVAGRLSDRIGGKFILMAGLTLYGVGMAMFLLAAQPDSEWPVFLPSMIVAGIGIGCVFAPMATEAMRSVEPRMAGAAAGVNNTVRQVGSVLGSAVVGAVLQNRVVTSLQDEAARRAAELPPSARGPFVAGFRDAANGGLEVGAGQGGAAAQLPPDVPRAVADRIQQVAAEVFSNGFVHAMRPTMAVPIAVILAGAAVCLLVRRHEPATAPEVPLAAEATVPH